MRIDRVRFAAALASADLKVYELAQRAGVSRPTITAVKSGKSCSKETAEKYGVAQEKKPEKKDNGFNLAPYSVEQYSFDKRLPVEFLQQTCRVSTRKERGGITCLQMAYFTEDDKEAAIRKRYGGKHFTWQRGSKGKICL